MRHIREYLVPVSNSATITRTDICHRSQRSNGMKTKAVVSVCEDLLRSGVTAPGILHLGNRRKRLWPSPRYGRVAPEGRTPWSSRMGVSMTLSVSYDAVPSFSCRFRYPGLSNYGNVPSNRPRISFLLTRLQQIHGHRDFLIFICVV